MLILVEELSNLACPLAPNVWLAAALHATSVRLSDIRIYCFDSSAVRSSNGIARRTQSAAEETWLARGEAGVVWARGRPSGGRIFYLSKSSGNSSIFGVAINGKNKLHLQEKVPYTIESDLFSSCCSVIQMKFGSE
jgi:hypothetical protein